jgi:hypothetical protein
MSALVPCRAFEPPLALLPPARVLSGTGRARTAACSSFPLGICQSWAHPVTPHPLRASRDRTRGAASERPRNCLSEAARADCALTEAEARGRRLSAVGGCGRGQRLAGVCRCGDAQSGAPRQALRGRGDALLSPTTPDPHARHTRSPQLAPAARARRPDGAAAARPRPAGRRVAPLAAAAKMLPATPPPAAVAVSGRRPRLEVPAVVMTHHWDC